MMEIRSRLNRGLPELGRRSKVPYYVVGGRYADTTFRTLLDPEPSLGPFSTHAEALEAWRARARATIDYATVRFQIVWRDAEDEAASPSMHAPDAVA
jgi:hypothetical protein